MKVPKSDFTKSPKQPVPSDQALLDLLRQAGEPLRRVAPADVASDALAAELGRDLAVYGLDGACAKLAIVDAVLGSAPDSGAVHHAKRALRGVRLLLRAVQENLATLPFPDLTALLPVHPPVSAPRAPRSTSSCAKPSARKSTRKAGKAQP